jgi:UDPglucose 6-dehydrogenase
LKSERRIGPAAYLSPGAAFAGGTLARDVVFLGELGKRVKRDTPLIDGILRSNVAHRGWAARRIASELGEVRGRKIAVWGLTYKPGTDTLRRSMAVELCEWLAREGAAVAVHDPAVGELPVTFPAVTRSDDPVDAARGADIIVVATEWPEYRKVTPTALLDVVHAPVVLDANGFLRSTLGADGRVRLVSVGQPKA